MGVAHKRVQWMKITISGHEITFRKALPDDIDKIKSLVDKHKTELGFIIRPALINSIKTDELIVAVGSVDDIVGLAHYRHRKDGQTTLYNIVVRSDYRRHAIGSTLVECLKDEAHSRGQHFILLKCPATLSANEFYKALNFELDTIEDGKKRTLNIWNLPLSEA